MLSVDQEPLPTIKGQTCISARSTFKNNAVQFFSSYIEQLEISDLLSIAFQESRIVLTQYYFLNQNAAVI